MPTPNNAAKPVKSAEPKREAPAVNTAPVAAKAPVASAMDAGAAKALVVTPPPAKPAAPVVIEAVVIETVAAKENVSAAFKFDSAEWSKRTFDLWSENATAVFDLADQIAKAKSVDEVVSLQSRFATDRFESFLRQSKEAMAFAQSLFVVATKPFYGAPAA